MRKFLALLRVDFKGLLFSMNLSGGSKKRQASGAFVLLMAGALCLLLSGTYSFSFGMMLAEVGAVDLLLLLMPLIAVFFSLVLTVMGAQGIVFNTKDMDLALALPVSPFTLMLSRMLALYLENLFLCAVWLLPAWAAWLVYGGAGGALSLAALLPGILLLAVAPTLGALLVGFVLAWLTSRFTHKALVSNLLYMGSLLLVLVASFGLNGMAATSLAGLQEMVEGWGLPLLLFQRAVAGPDLLALLGLAALVLLPLLALVWLFSCCYLQVLTGLSSHRARFDYKLGRLRAGKQLPALMARELKRYFGIPIYFFNTGFGLILMLVAGVAAVLQRGRLEQLLAMPELAGLPVLPLLAAALGFILSMTDITACSISLEGNQLWILKEAPLAVSTIFAAKAGFQVAVVTPCLLLSVGMVWFGFALPAAQALLLFVLGLAYTVCNALFGLLVNLLLPKLDAPNAMVVVKQSAATMVALLGSFLLAGAGVGLYFLLEGFGLMVALWVPAAFYAVCAGVLTLLLAGTGRRLFEAL